MLVAIGGCSKEVPLDQLVTRDGLEYEVDSQTPFTGSSVKYHDNGRLHFTQYFKDGKLDGLREAYHDNGQFMFKQNWKDGELDPLWEMYDENGQLESKN